MRIINSFIVLIALFLTPAAATAISLLRDSDVEHALQELARPILQAANLPSERVKILVVDDLQLNAFVIDNHHIFLNAGMVLKTNSASMLQSIIAHEAAHIANGHIARRAKTIKTARSAAGFGMALGIAAGAAGGNVALGTGLAIGLNSSAERNFLAYNRSEESSADQSAMQYMRRAGVSLQGMADVLEIFSGQESLLPARQDTYLRSHPLSRERLRQARSNAATQSSSKPDLSAEYWHARAKAKLAAFLRPPSTILAREQRKLPKDLKAISKAIALSRQGQLSKALDQLRIAQSVRPKDPYYQDLYAELLMRNQKFSAAVTAYEKAVAMAPKDSLILAGYGRALLANNQISAALKTLENARSRDFRSTKLLRDLAVAYARSDKPEMAALVTAERFALQGRLKDANIHAKRAVLGLPTGSPAWQKAQDILSISTK